MLTHPSIFFFSFNVLCWTYRRNVTECNTVRSGLDEFKMSLQRSARQKAYRTLQALLSQTASSTTHNPPISETSTTLRSGLTSIRWLIGNADANSNANANGAKGQDRRFSFTPRNPFSNHEGSSNYVKSLEQSKLHMTRPSWMAAASWHNTYSTTSREEPETENLRQVKGLSSLIHRLPPALVPYAQLSRLDKPIGTWLLAWPCFWSIMLAASSPLSLDTLHMLSLFGGGALILRGAGCTINDLWDKDLDRQVERTKLRPLASGVLTTGQGIAWLGIQLTAGLGILLQLNQFSQVLGASSLALVVTYPLMKRITGWPQAFLGLTFNWGALLGWAAVNNGLDPEVVLPLYAGGVAWTLVYDTIYAHQDKADDAMVGVKSTALTFGQYNRAYLSGFAAANVACMAFAGHAAGCGAIFDSFLSLAALQLAWQVLTVDFNNPQDCANKFKSNFWYGLILFSGIAFDKLL